MFERYTESARRALFFARYEAGQRGSVSIESEHLLLGLVREGKGPVGRLLAKFQVSPPILLRQVDARTHVRERVPPATEIPFSQETQHCLNFACEEADRFQHKHIGPEHLFLGMLRADRSLAASILIDQGITLEAARDHIGTAPSPPSPANETTGGDSRLEFIKHLVEQLGGMDADSVEGRSLVALIHSEIDALRPHLGKS
jgi:ATP-dependent Clp protease ATP-binding subunit ClpC